MDITISDIMHLDLMKGIKLIAGAGGTQNKVAKVGILDFEFTRRAAAPTPDRQQHPGEFVLASFLYAADNSDLLLGAVKRMKKNQASGLAIKNVFNLEIDQAVLRYANENDFPVFLFVDYGVYFEDLIVEISRLKDTLAYYALCEDTVNKILHGSFDKTKIKKLALEINYSIKNFYNITYFRPKNEKAQREADCILARGVNKRLFANGDALVKYKAGMFFISSSEAQPQAEEATSDSVNEKLQTNIGQYHVGVSDNQYYLEDIKTAFLQSYYASCHAQLYGRDTSLYKNIGVYKLLFHSLDERWQEDYVNGIITPIEDYDLKNKSGLLSTLLEYERQGGNIKETATALFTHENTVRYRLKKTAEIFSTDISDKNFEFELFMALKLHRMQNLWADTPQVSIQNSDSTPPMSANFVAGL